MNWNDHSNLEGMHAFLGASKSSWLNYDQDRLIEAYKRSDAAKRGTIIHDFARRCIDLRQKLPRSKKTLNSYVNDAIGYRMQPERILYYSPNAFGTADAISFRDNFLRIHDLKTGVSPVHIEQLMIYAALFCLEYRVKPADIGMELRIYQNDEIMICNPESKDILDIANKIVEFDKILQDIQKEV